jgi:2,4-dienoyl-CoA reductase-like NADH-dependent reductase (Old Yellow Enzyme family)
MTPVLRDPIDIGRLALRNRLYRAPVLKGAGQARDPVRTYAKHFVANAKAGVGLVIQGNTIVTPEGRTSPGMSCATDRDSIVRFRAMTDAVHAEGAAVAIQLGHGGAFAIEAWHTAHRPHRSQLPLAPSRLPRRGTTPSSWPRATRSCCTCS